MPIIACIAAILLTAATIEGAVPKPRHRQANSLRGSRDSQIRQNKEADEEELIRIENDDQLEELKQLEMLVPLPEASGIKVDNRLDPKLRFCRPQTAKFLIATQKEVGGELQINSAVRTIEYQQELRKTNTNAAPPSGPNASSHLVGSTIDITKIGMSPYQLRRMRNYLTRLKNQGYIWPVEEFRQSVFHIMVFQKYLTYEDSAPSKPSPAKKKRR